MKKRSFRPFILPLLLVVGTVFYYFGELVNWAAWNALRLNFFYSVHDVHRLFFVIPIIYAGYNARIKGALIITLVSFIIFLPRAVFISPYPDPLLRMILFIIFAGALGCLTGIVRNQTERARRLEAMMTAQKDRMLQIIDNVADGVVVTGPDYKIRFMNSRMKNEFGDGIGLTCYEYLHAFQEPCKECKIQSVINDKEICRWRCQFPDGRVCNVVAAPYRDADGTDCHIAIFRDIAPRQTG